MSKLTDPQRRLVQTITQYGDYAEYWPVVNDWVKDKGPAKAFALRNINRSIDVLIREGIVTLDEDGLLRLTGKQNIMVSGR